MNFPDQMPQPTRLVSIVLTTLNCGCYLRQAIDSCLMQTHSEIELIVVDGGSTDDTLKVVAEYPDSRVRLIHQRNNVGKLPGAINLGLASAKGDYLTWMQGDSVYHLRAMETMVQCLERYSEIGQVYADYWVINEAGEIIEARKTCPPEEILKAKSDPCGVCFLIRKSVRERAGCHDVDAYPTQDYDYRMRVAMQFKSMHLSESLYYWRLHPASLTGSRPWTVDAYNDVRIRRKLGLSNAQQALAELAAIDMARAFECYERGSLDQVRSLAWSGLRGDPRFVLNRGVWSILLKSAFKRSRFTDVKQCL